MKLLRSLVVAAGLLALVAPEAACSTTQKKPDVVSGKVRKAKRTKKPGATMPIGQDGAVDEGDDDTSLTDGSRVGNASFYADSLKGRLTANGERYDPDEATCAHRSLPFGTVLRVVDVKTGKESTCVVNDRGPFVKDRMLDVSKRVANELGMQEKGVARVRVYVIDDEDRRQI